MKDGIYYLLPKRRNLARKGLSEKARKTWHGGIVENGEVRWESLHTTNKEAAMNWYKKMNSGLWVPDSQDSNPVGLEPAFEAFILDVENVRKRVAGTVRLYRRYLAKLKKFCEEKRVGDLRELTPTLCFEFAQAEFANLAANSAKNEIIAFRHFYSWCAEHYNLSGKNPFKKIVVAKPKPVPREFWTVEECEKIIAAAPSDEYKCWFALMAFAGLRREEARHLKYESVSDGKISLIGKGGKHAEIPVSSRLKTYLNEYLVRRGEAPGFLFPKLAKLTKAKEEVIKKAVEKANLQSSGIAHYHRFRHSFASNLLRVGRSIKAVQLLMRHEDVALTLRTYSHLLPSDLANAVEL
jgi:integrase/recombinase XerC